MADVNATIQYLINEWGFVLIIIGFMVIALIYVVRVTKKVPPKPDYMRILKDRSMKDHALNKPDKRYGLKYAYRGHELLGKIMTHSTELRDVSKEVQKNLKQKLDRKQMIVHTITFKKPIIPKAKVFFGKEILKYSDEDNFKIENGKLVFPSSTSFVALGDHYSTVTSYPYLSRIIEDDFNRHFFSMNTHVFASNMARVSSELPEHAHELQLKRLEIEKIKAEKQIKFGQL